MGVKVDVAVARMRSVLAFGDAEAAEAAMAGDDEIDAMNVSLTERCYDLLAREAPVADDLRFIVSVLRILSELERVGDLALRVVNLEPERHLLVADDDIFDTLVAMADTALDAYRCAVAAWSAQDLEMATTLATQGRVVDNHYERLTRRLLQLSGDHAVAIATTSLIAGRSLERIADHSLIVGARLRYLLTGDPDHLSAEVR